MSLLIGKNPPGNGYGRTLLAIEDCMDARCRGRGDESVKIEPDEGSAGEGVGKVRSALLCEKTGMGSVTSSIAEHPDRSAVAVCSHGREIIGKRRGRAGKGSRRGGFR